MLIARSTGQLEPEQKKSCIWNRRSTPCHMPDWIDSAVCTCTPRLFIWHIAHCCFQRPWISRHTLDPPLFKLPFTPLSLFRVPITLSEIRVWCRFLAVSPPALLPAFWKLLPLSSFPPLSVFRVQQRIWQLIVFIYLWNVPIVFFPRICCGRPWRVGRVFYFVIFLWQHFFFQFWTDSKAVFSQEP